jgi:hypothetical protein
LTDSGDVFRFNSRSEISRSDLKFCCFIRGHDSIAIALLVQRWKFAQSRPITVWSGAVAIALWLEARYRWLVVKSKTQLLHA